MARIKKASQKAFTCNGGPYDGEDIKLSVDSSYVATSFFGVQSFHNGRRGRYVRDYETDGFVKWEWEQ